MFALFTLLKAPYNALKSFIAAHKAAVLSDVDVALLPFTKVHAQLVTVQAKVQAAEAALRAQAAAVIAQADVQAASGRQAAGAAAKLSDLLGKVG